MLIKASVSNAIITANIIASDGDMCVAVHVGPLYCVHNCGIAPGSLLLIQDGSPPFVVGVLGEFKSYALLAVDIDVLKCSKSETDKKKAFSVVSRFTVADAGPNLTAIWTRNMKPESLRTLLESEYPGKVLICEPSKVDIKRFYVVEIGEKSA
jgi:hypothetical protein